ncbi:DUF2807 domain-containing protein [Undibacterium jejuense]|uniref:DUF2807 domain-containing protein n=2 Tax=Undibacterium jejuense TaxID=1344949 RepID=A0A923HHU7_9BURK|nr:DUF2807 domain-containing protein [Undibacterium jejuense]MBC3862698.1 DUF2807 domain-containing protein [Undibacterium jejuense]
MKNFLSGRIFRLFIYIGLCTILETVLVADAQAVSEVRGGHARERRSIDARVTNVVMSGPIQFILKPSIVPDLYVTGDPSLVTKVTTIIDGNTLYIATKGIFIAAGKTQKTIVEIHLPKIEKLQCSANGDSSVIGFKGDNLDLDLRGSGNFILDADYVNLKIRSTGSGTVQLRLQNMQTISINSQGKGPILLNGQTKNFDAQVSGAGGLNATAMRAQQGTLNLTGSADVAVYVNTEISAFALGSGNLRILGNPIRRHVEHRGSGQIIWQ